VNQPIDKLLHKSLSDIQSTKSTQSKYVINRRLAIVCVYKLWHYLYMQVISGVPSSAMGYDAWYISTILSTEIDPRIVSIDVYNRVLQYYVYIQ